MKIFLTNISDMDEDSFNKGLKLVPEYRRKKVMRYRFKEDSRRSLAAGLLLNYATKVYSICYKEAVSDTGIIQVGITDLINKYDSTFDYEIEYVSNGKPVYRNQDIHFSLSHSGSYVVCAVSDKNIGVDIEGIRRNAIKVAKRFFTTAECEWIGSDVHRFSRIWTLKEAYAKLTGDGIAAAVSRAEFKHEADKVVKALKVVKDMTVKDDYGPSDNIVPTVNMYIAGKKADNIKIYELNIIKSEYAISVIECLSD